MFGNKKIPLSQYGRGALLICIFALLWGIYVLGTAPLDINNNDWLWGDLAHVYVAWSQYTSDPSVTWLHSNRMSYLIGINFALFDPMPILLLDLSSIFSLIPNKTQYLGIYFVACLLLQGLFGSLACRSKRSYEIFWYYTPEHNISTNNFYAARTLPEQRSYHCNYEQIDQRLLKNKIYVLLENFYETYGNHFDGRYAFVRSLSIKSTIICTPRQGVQQ